MESLQRSQFHVYAFDAFRIGIQAHGMASCQILLPVLARISHRTRITKYERIDMRPFAIVHEDIPPHIGFIQLHFGIEIMIPMHHPEGIIVEI
jgi:hypothetical protein